MADILDTLFSSIYHVRGKSTCIMHKETTNWKAQYNETADLVFIYETEDGFIISPGKGNAVQFVYIDEDVENSRVLRIVEVEDVTELSGPCAMGLYNASQHIWCLWKDDTLALVEHRFVTQIIPDVVEHWTFAAATEHMTLAVVRHFLRTRRKGVYGDVDAGMVFPSLTTLLQNKTNQ
jgi:hypothetical protein